MMEDPYTWKDYVRWIIAFILWTAPIWAWSWVFRGKV
jgi:hypothetical protein